MYEEQGRAQEFWGAVALTWKKGTPPPKKNKKQLTGYMKDWE